MAGHSLINAENLNAVGAISAGAQIIAVGPIQGDAVYGINLLQSPQVNTTDVRVEQPTPGNPGIIQLADNNNVLGILKSLDQDLYFNDELLAKAGDIQNVADWSLNPALQNVDMALQGLTNASAVGITDGVFPQFLTPSEKGLNINGSVVGVSTDSGTDTLWGTANTAVSDAQGANTLAGEALAAAEAAQGTADTAEATAVAAGVAAAAAAATAATALAQSGVTAVNSQTGGILLQSSGNTVTITNPSSGRINFEVPAGAGGVSSLNTLVGALSVAAGTNISVVPSGGNTLTINNTAPTPVTSLNTFTGGLTLAAGTNISVVPSGGNTLTINNTAAASVAFSYNLYVSNVSGSDSLGNGQIGNPYKTIGAAVAFANTISDANPVIINLACGSYTENVNITRDNTYITGGSTSLSSATIINGTVLFDMTGTSQLVVVGGVSSVQMYRLQVSNTVAKNQSIVITDCILIPPTTLNCILATDTSVGGNCDITIQNSLLYAYDGPAGFISNVAANFVNTQITVNPTVIYNGSFLITQGTGRVNLFGCSVIQPSTSSTVQPLVDFQNNVSTPNGMVFNSSLLQYTSATSDAGTLGKACVRFSNAAGVTMGVSTASPSLSMINCFLQCQGATTTNGSAGQFVCIQKATGGGTAYFNWLSCACGATANHISQFLTRTSWVALSA
jgi:hypothetical protein